MNAEKLRNDLMFYSTTLHAHPDVRSLLAQAGAEIDWLRGFQSAIKCSCCAREVMHSNDWFRCFDCGAHLCRECVRKHFGDKYTPHHQRMEDYQRTIQFLQARIERLTAQVSNTSCSSCLM